MHYFLHTCLRRVRRGRQVFLICNNPAIHLSNNPWDDTVILLYDINSDLQQSNNLIIQEAIVNIKNIMPGVSILFLVLSAVAAEHENLLEIGLNPILA